MPSFIRFHPDSIVWRRCHSYEETFDIVISRVIPEHRSIAKSHPAMLEYVFVMSENFKRFRAGIEARADWSITHSLSCRIQAVIPDAEVKRMTEELRASEAARAAAEAAKASAIRAAEARAASATAVVSDSKKYKEIAATYGSVRIAKSNRYAAEWWLEKMLSASRGASSVAVEDAKAKVAKAVTEFREVEAAAEAHASAADRAAEASRAKMEADSARVERIMREASAREARAAAEARAVAEARAAEAAEKARMAAETARAAEETLAALSIDGTAGRALERAIAGAGSTSVVAVSGLFGASSVVAAAGIVETTGRRAALR